MNEFLLGVLASLTASFVTYIVSKKVKSHSEQESDLELDVKIKFNKKRH
ncbi:hypothetical protein KW95_20410 [Clostridioides difficile]|nr:hypothetical protein KW95_20410 [Clostridioides difficile]